METLHLRATQHTMQFLMDSINKIAKDGNKLMAKNELSKSCL